MKVYTSLKNILLMNFMFVALIPLAVVGVISLHTLVTGIEQEITRKNFLLAQSLAGEVERFLEEPLSLLRQLQEIVDSSPLLEDEECDAYLSLLLRNYTTFDTIMLLDETGRVRHLAPYNEDIVHNDMSGQTFFQAARQKPYWSPTFLSIQSGRPTLTLSFPLEQGSIVGYLNLEALNPMIEKMSIGENGYALIVDSNGIVIAHPRSAVVLQRLNVSNLAAIRQGLSLEEGTFRYWSNGVEKLGSIAIVPQTNWLVGVVQPIDEAFSPIRDIQKMIGLGIGIAAMLASGMAFFSIRKALSPLSQLTFHTQQIAQGDYHLLPAQKHYLEIDELTHHFNMMVEAVKTREKALQDKQEQLRLDVRERKDIETRIRELNSELEQRVTERTAELESVNKDLRNFIYAASHDLKTPLRGISQLAYWLVEDYAEAFDEEGQHLVELLLNRIQRMDNLLNGILEYSNVGRVPADCPPINLNNLLDEVIQTLVPPEHIHIALESPLPDVSGHTSHVAQVFQHLLKNAIEFMDKPDGQITIRCVEKKTHTLFSVGDNGPGIEERYHDQIFQIFQTLEPHDARESTGIGLSLVKKIVESYGGTIWLESTPHEGSTFFFTWPK